MHIVSSYKSMMKILLGIMVTAFAFALKHNIDQEYHGITNLLSRLNTKNEGIKASAYNMRHFDENSIANLHAIQEKEDKAVLDSMSRYSDEFEKLKDAVQQVASKRISYE